MEDTNWERPCLKYKSSVPAGYEDGTVDCATCGWMESQHEHKHVYLEERNGDAAFTVTKIKHGK